MGNRLRAVLATFVAAATLIVVGCIVVRSNEQSFTRGDSTSQSDNQIKVADLKPDPAGGSRLIGSWRGTIADRRNSFVQLEITRTSPGGGSSVSSYGLSADDAKPFLRDGDGDVHVQLKREAGALSLEGAIAKGRANGNLAFVPDANYVREVARQTGETVPAETALELALVDLPLDFVKRIEAAGYKASISDLIGLRFAGVTPEYAVGLRDAGYTFNAGDVRALRFAGVDLNWAKQYRDAGYRFSADDLRSLRFGGVDSSWAKQYRDAGYEFNADQLRSLRFGAVSPEFAAEFRRAGFKLDVDGLRSLRFAGVPADFAGKLHDAGYSFTTDELRSLRFAGVSANDAATMKKAGYNFSADELRRLRFSGVPADYAVAAAVPGHANLSAEELVRLRQRGVDVGTIQKLRQ